MKQTITIPDYKLPSRNQLYSSGHWRTSQKIVKQAHEIISAYIPRKMITGLVDITIHAHYKTKQRRDSDNVEAKLVIDCLKGKVIEDDDYRFVRDVTTRVVVGSDSDRVEIYIEVVQQS